MPNSMILAQVVLQIFCSQGSIGLKFKSKKGRKTGNKFAITSPTEKKNQRTIGPVLLT